MESLVACKGQSDAYMCPVNVCLMRRCVVVLQLEMRKTRAEAARAEMLLKMADERKRQDEAKRRYHILKYIIQNISKPYNIPRTSDIL